MISTEGIWITYGDPLDFELEAVCNEVQQISRFSIAFNDDPFMGHLDSIMIGHDGIVTHSVNFNHFLPGARFEFPSRRPGPGTRITVKGHYTGFVPRGSIVGREFLLTAIFF